MHEEHRRDDFLISTDPDRLDLTAVHAFLSSTYWARGVALEVVARSLRHSLCFGLYQGERQIGLARVITDRATFGYVADVYVLDPYRGQGLAKWLMTCVLAHPDLRTVRRLMLATRDAHGLYSAFGFRPLRAPGEHLEWRPAAANSVGRAESDSAAVIAGGGARCEAGPEDGEQGHGREG